MKKLTAVLFSLVIMFSSFAMAADPIVGTWYSDWEDAYLLGAPGYEGCQKILIFYTFFEDGKISLCEYSFYSDKIVPVYSIYDGDWEKGQGDTYYIKLIANGEHIVTLKNNELYVPITKDKLLFRVHKMEPLNIYEDIIEE